MLHYLQQRQREEADPGVEVPCTVDLRHALQGLFDQAGVPDIARSGVPIAWPDLAHGYVDDVDFGNPETPSVVTTMKGAGGYACTVGELHRWVHALEDGTVLPNELTTAMFTDHVAPDHPHRGYGYGWEILETIRGTPVIRHGGTYNGFNAEVRRYPEEGKSIVFLSNTMSLGREMRDAVVNQIALLMMERDVPRPPAALAWNDAEATRCAGRYRTDEDTTFAVRATADRLLVEAAEQSAIDILYPVDGSSEDLTFTTGGEIMARNGAAFARIAPDGSVQAFNTMSALPATTLGLRWTPGGNLMTASQTTNEILEIAPTGAVTQFLGGLGIPNGIFVALDGNVFFSDFTAPRAAWADPTGTMVTDLAVGGADAPQTNGIIYDPDRNYVYYVSYGPGILWRVDVTDLANPGAPENLLTIASEGGGDQVGLDGIAMDECGNLYIVDQNQGDPGSLYRVQLDEMGDLVGGEELLVDVFPDGVANAVFAQGAAWAAYDTSLFLVGLPGRIFIVDVGVAGAPTPVGG